MSDLVKRFTASVAFDQRLAQHDIRASLAHARMLLTCGVISKGDFADIERGMQQICQEIEAGAFAWSLEAEDVHLNIERRLIELINEANKQLHTARSRNDQMTTNIQL